MKKDNVILVKTYSFALKSIKIYKKIVDEKREYVISKQFLKSSTSIGANAEEAIGGQSKKDFLSKLSIAYKEARETQYWLRLLRDADYIDTLVAKDLLNDCDEILRIIGAIQTSTKRNLNS